MFESNTQVSQKNIPPDIFLFSSVVKQSVNEQIENIANTKSFMRNTILLDFRYIEINKKEAIDVIVKNFEKATHINFLSKGKLVELGFATLYEAEEALLKDVEYKDLKINIMQTYHVSENVSTLKISNIPHNGNEKYAIDLLKKGFSKYGVIKNIEICKLRGTNLMLPEAFINIVLNTKELPRSLELENNIIFVNWRGAKPRCFYCKNVGHITKTCPNLINKKLNNTNIKKFSQNNQYKRSRLNNEENKTQFSNDNLNSEKNNKNKKNILENKKTQKNIENIKSQKNTTENNSEIEIININNKLNNFTVENNLNNKDMNSNFVGDKTKLMKDLKLNKFENINKFHLIQDNELDNNVDNLEVNNLSENILVTDNIVYEDTINKNVGLEPMDL